MEKLPKLKACIEQLFTKMGIARVAGPVVKSRQHTVISGTGRAGTTFLIQLFTALGFDTGFRCLTSHVFENCNAGMERDLRSDRAPYVIKDPMLCNYLDEFLGSPGGTDVVVDHLIVPVRDLHSAAESRRDVSRRSDPSLYPEGPPGGVWLTNDPGQQEIILQELLYNLIFAAAKWDIPVILLHFPRIVNDHAYLYEKLRPALKGVAYEDFLQAVRTVAKPELVHKFVPQAA